MTDIIANDNAFPASYQAGLLRLMDLMIPAEGDLPGAADPAIAARTLKALRRDAELVTQGLEVLAELAENAHGQRFVDLSADACHDLVATLRNRVPAFLALLEAEVPGSYYQDDRVLAAIGLPQKPPHPGGYEVQQTNWSLLDAVRLRQPFYRDS